MNWNFRTQILSILIIGMTVAASPAEARQVSVVALGDSNTNGFGIGSEFAWPTLIEKWLRAKGADVKIRNAGVTARTTRGGLKRLKRAVPDGSDAVIVFLGRNDLRFKFSPDTTRRNIDQIVRELRERELEVLLIGFEPYDLSGIAKKYGADYYPDFFAGVTEDGVKLSKYVIRFDPFRHLNASGHEVVAKRLLPSIEKLVRRTGK